MNIAKLLAKTKMSATHNGLTSCRSKMVCCSLRKTAVRIILHGLRNDSGNSKETHHSVAGLIIASSFQILGRSTDSFSSYRFDRNLLLEILVHEHKHFLKPNVRNWQARVTSCSFPAETHLTQVVVSNCVGKVSKFYQKKKILSDKTVFSPVIPDSKHLLNQ